MTTAKFVQPDYTTQSGTVYPLGLDAAAKVMSRLAVAFAPRAQDTPNMTVQVEAGYVLSSALVLTEFGPQATGTITAPVGNPRIDRVVIDRVTGAVSVVTGTPAGSPTPPAIPSGKRPVAQVLLQTSSTVITNSMLTDERVQSTPTPLTAAEIGAVPDTGGVVTGNVTISTPNAAINLDATGGTPALVRWYNNGALKWQQYNDGSGGDDLALVRGAGATLVLDFLQSTGAARFWGLLDLSASGAGQIKFPATQNASSDANTLDDYEEGTWTPSLGGSTTYTTQLGTYTKIGRMVYHDFYVQINAIGSGNTNDLSGLPFTAAAGTGATVPIYWIGANAAIVYAVGLVAPSTAVVAIKSITAASTSLGTTGLITSSTLLSGSGCYKV